MANGLNPDDPSDASLDSDGDGFTNLQEYVAGTDPRETATDPDAGNADVVQCRTTSTTTDKKGNTSTSFSGDQCPHAGGIDQNIYGDKSP